MPEEISLEREDNNLRPLLPQARRSGARAQEIRDELANYCHELRNNM